MTRTVAVLGSTGSVGTQTLDVLSTGPAGYRVGALGACRSVDLLVEQAHRFRPAVVALVDPDKADGLAERLPVGTDLLVGDTSLAIAASTTDIVINAVVGFAGLPVTLAALKAGKRLGLANKESLIAAGPVVQRFRSTPGAEIVPIDSEHCAVHQCLQAGRQPGRRASGMGRVQPEELAAVVLTASGGPFRGHTLEQLESVTVADALAHPTWRMGPKITVDSSTLMNKGFEVIEAHELFGVGYDQIEVVVHPQSVVHSMVTFRDGATIAQLSMPDMRLCIGHALAFPDRLSAQFGAIDWAKPRRLDFEPPDRKTFACIDLAYEAGRAGETAPAWLNAANEVAVAAFLDGRIAWSDIAPLLADTLACWPGDPASNVESVLAADSEARRVAGKIVASQQK